MSGKIMGKVWDLELPHNKLIVLLAMADHAHHDGSHIFPSMDLIAWKTGYSKRQVQRIIKILEDDGLLVKTERPGATNLYSIDLSAGRLKEPFENQNVTPDKMSNSDIETDIGQNVTPDTQMSQVGGHPDVTPTPDTQMSPEPSLEPLIKQQAAIARPQPTPVAKPLIKDTPKQNDKFPIIKDLIEPYMVGTFTTQHLQMLKEDSLIYPIDEWKAAIDVYKQRRYEKSQKGEPSIHDVYKYLLGILKKRAIEAKNAPPPVIVPYHQPPKLPDTNISEDDQKAALDTVLNNKPNFSKIKLPKVG